MSAETEETETVIWGISVPMKVNGKRSWPEAIKSLAVEKAIGGARIADIAEEIGAHKSLVAKWMNNPPSDRASTQFVEVVPAIARDGGCSTPATAPALRIKVGDAEITVDAGYPGDLLTTLLRAVRDSQ